MASMIYSEDNTIKVAYGRFGWVRNNGKTFHGGKDISTKGSPTIHSTVNGKVKFALMVKKGAAGWGATWEWGYFVWIVADDGTDHIFAHCKAGSLLVKAGQRVKAGQAIATMGNTGNANLDSQGAHVHYEVRKNGKAIDSTPWDGIPNQVGTTINSQKANSSPPQPPSGFRKYSIRPTATLNVRSGAGTTFPIIRTISSQHAYTVLEVKGNWGRIAIGWICLDYTKRA